MYYCIGSYLLRMSLSIMTLGPKPIGISVADRKCHRPRTLRKHPLFSMSQSSDHIPHAETIEIKHKA